RAIVGELSELKAIGWRFKQLRESCDVILRIFQEWESRAIVLSNADEQRPASWRFLIETPLICIYGRDDCPTRSQRDKADGESEDGKLDKAFHVTSYRVSRAA